MSEPHVTVVLNAHAEKPEWVKRALESILRQHEAPPFEVLVVADKPTEDVVSAASASGDGRVTVDVVDYGDLGMSRNHGATAAASRYVAFLDSDDLYGATWLRDAYKYAQDLREKRGNKGLEAEDFCLHQEFMCMFGAENFLHRCIGDDSPQWDAKDLVQFNAWAASTFGPRSMYLKHPYFNAGYGFGYEDHDFHCRSHGAGVSHRVVPKSVYAVRLKRDNTSMAWRYVQSQLMIPAQPIFDRRDLPDATEQPPKEEVCPPEVNHQLLFIHHEIGERLVMTTNETGIRRYPRARCFADQAKLRDDIGDAKHVVLVRELLPGGAEKYAINWARAIGATIVETEPKKSPWAQRARDAGVKVVQWNVIQKDMNPEEAVYTLKRALVQCKLESVFCCNSPIGWVAIHDNAQVLARRVFAASFAPIPAGHGYTSCPPYHLKHIAPNLKIITDNEEHADRIRDYNGAKVTVVPPRVEYGGQSKLSRIDKDRWRILWAGRGTPEKRPDVLPALAAAMEATADIHVWGDVRPLNGPESLKYRGPFDGFEKIDGSYDCYLITSAFEGMPNTACEAALADLPVVGPHIGGLPKIATTTYKKFDPLVVSQAIMAAIDKGPSTRNQIKEKIGKWAAYFNDTVKDLVTA